MIPSHVSSAVDNYHRINHTIGAKADNTILVDWQSAPEHHGGGGHWSTSTIISSTEGANHYNESGLVLLSQDHHNRHHIDSNSNSNVGVGVDDDDINNLGSCTPLRLNYLDPSCPDRTSNLSIWNNNHSNNTSIVNNDTESMLHYNNTHDALSAAASRAVLYALHDAPPAPEISAAVLSTADQYKYKPSSSSGRSIFLFGSETAGAHPSSPALSMEANPNSVSNNTASTPSPKGMALSREYDQYGNGEGLNLLQAGVLVSTGSGSGSCTIWPGLSMCDGQGTCTSASSPNVSYASNNYATIIAGAIPTTGTGGGESELSTAIDLYSHQMMPGSGGLGQLVTSSARPLQEAADRLYSLSPAQSQSQYPGGSLGLNLGGRTYFSTSDNDLALGRLLASSKRLRPILDHPSSAASAYLSLPESRDPYAHLRHHQLLSSGLGFGMAAQMQPVAAPLCQAEGCKADLSLAKHYHRRHKVCEYHSKASTVHVGNQTQRFCQQCSRFHMLVEFDDGKRSCRKRLADHNRRRRKPVATSCSTSTLTTATATTNMGSSEAPITRQDSRAEGGSTNPDNVNAGSELPRPPEKEVARPSGSCSSTSSSSGNGSGVCGGGSENGS